MIAHEADNNIHKPCYVRITRHDTETPNETISAAYPQRYPVTLSAHTERQSNLNMYNSGEWQTTSRWRSDTEGIRRPRQQR